MNEQNTLTNEDFLFNSEDMSTFILPAEVKLNWVLRYTYKLQRLYDLNKDELDHLYSLYDEFKRKEFRNQELVNQNAELRKTIKQLHDSNNQLTMKLLRKRK